jgi:hypothetical protein
MKIKYFTYAVMAMSTSFIWGCSIYSDPVQTTTQISSANGTQYNVQCDGLFGSASVCARQMKKICGDNRVQQVEIMNSRAPGQSEVADSRNVTFMCIAANGNHAGDQVKRTQ